MTLPRLGLLTALCLSLLFLIRALSQPPEPSSQLPGPISVSYAVGAHAGVPVIYRLTINGGVLFSASVADFGAMRIPPIGSGRIILDVPALPAPDHTKLDIKLEWTEIWTGRQYETQTRLDKADFPWLEDSSIPLYMTFEPHGGFVIRIISQERWEGAMARTTSTLPTLADYPIVYDTCAPRIDTPPLSAAKVKAILATIWGADLARLKAKRTTPVPTPRCPDPVR